MDIAGKSVMILGEGVSGKAAYEALKGISRPYFYNKSDFILENGKIPLLKSGNPPDLVIISPGISSHPVIEYAAQNNIAVISEMELGYLLNSSPIVAITGTNGKTTVTRLIGEILNTEKKAAVCGNIGDAFCSAALTQHEVAVVEVSSFQLERCYQFNPQIAIITNITPDHLDRHGDMENYIKTKCRLMQNQTEKDYLICPYELSAHLKDVKAKIIYSDIDCRFNNGVICFFDEFIMPVSDINLIGEHNLKNVMQAVCAAKLLGINNENIRAAVSAFKPDAHRLQKISSAFNKEWFDDSKATNIDSCLVACRSMQGATALILGGSDKGYEYDELFINLPKNMSPVFIMGDVKEKLAQAAKRQKFNVIPVENLAQAVTLAAKSKAKNVLLSPAAASFDHFKDYKDRGEQFKKLIEQADTQRG